MGHSSVGKSRLCFLSMVEMFKFFTIKKFLYTACCMASREYDAKVVAYIQSLSARVGY